MEGPLSSESSHCSCFYESLNTLLLFELLTGMWLLFWDKSFHWKLGRADQAVLTDLWASCLCPFALAVLTDKTTYSFSRGCWGPNADSHACMASTLPALSFCFPYICWLGHYYSTFFTICLGHWSGYPTEFLGLSVSVIILRTRFFSQISSHDQYSKMATQVYKENKSLGLW